MPDIGGAAIAQGNNHLTALSHDQKQLFMNDTLERPQWPTLEVLEQASSSTQTSAAIQFKFKEKAENFFGLGDAKGLTSLILA